jgi:hypothetical protein
MSSPGPRPTAARAVPWLHLTVGNNKLCLLRLSIYPNCRSFQEVSTGNLVKQWLSEMRANEVPAEMVGKTATQRLRTATNRGRVTINNNASHFLSTRLFARKSDDGERYITSRCLRAPASPHHPIRLRVRARECQTHDDIGFEASSSSHMRE